MRWNIWNMPVFVILVILMQACADSGREQAQRQPAEGSDQNEADGDNTDLGGSRSDRKNDAEPNRGGQSSNENSRDADRDDNRDADRDDNTEENDRDSGNDSSASQDDCYKSESQICAIEREIGRLVNEERAKRNLPAVTFSAKASFAARQWSEQQAKRGWIGHDGFPRARERVYQEEFKESLNSSAENVAMTSRGDAATIAREFMRMWMNSLGHRINILGNSRGLGVGVAAKESRFGGQQWYGTQIFTSR